jgi:uncharacterized protein (DUF433 family)/predicted nuclease of predicted toxin-antitoxin system
LLSPSLATEQVGPHSSDAPLIKQTDSHDLQDRILPQ